MSRLAVSLRFIGRVCLGLFLTAPAWAQLNYATPYSFTTVAGTDNVGSVDGTGSAARFNEPSGVAADASGNVYVADSSNKIIRKITPAGVVTTFAGTVGSYGLADGPPGTAQFKNPRSVAVDSAGNVYVADESASTIRKITPAGVTSTFAGGTGLSDDSGFTYPQGVAVDSAGNVYVADTGNSRIRKITPAGVVSPLAGAGPGYADGTGTGALFKNPQGVAVDAAGNVYVGDTDNQSIRKITPAGVVTTLAGSPGLQGNVDGTGGDARFFYITSVAVDSAGNVFAIDGYSQILRKISPTGVVTTIAGTINSIGSSDGAGGAARFYNALGVGVDGAGNIYVADSENQAIRKVSPAGQVSTLAGVGHDQSQGSKDGPGTVALFANLHGVAIGPAGELYVADYFNQSVRKITPAGVVSTLAGTAGAMGSTDGAGNVATFQNPDGIAVDTGGNVYVADGRNATIRKITPAGVVSTLAGTPGVGGNSDGTGSAARFAAPQGLAIDSGGNLYVADSANCTIRKVTTAGVVTTIAGLAGLSGSVDGTGSAARFNQPGGVAIDSAGNLYVADTFNGTVRKISPAGEVTTLAGLALNGLSSVDGTGSAARFGQDTGLAVDAAGNVFVADSNNNVIRKITPAGEVTTVAGSPSLIGSVDGTGSAATFNSPQAVAVDTAGVLYVVSGPTVRRGQLPGPPGIISQPQSLTVTAGDSVQFSVTASGAPAPTYQWYYNGSAYNGATASTLSFTNARSSDAGDYTVVVTNSLGSVTSSKATLTVKAVTPPPTPPPASGGGGGGGGAPTPWFLVALLMLATVRHLRPRARRT